MAVGGLLVMLSGVVVAPTTSAAEGTPTPLPGATVQEEPPATTAGPAGPALGASAGESLLRLYDVVKVTAGYIAATQLQPGGGSVAPGGDSGWKPRAAIKAPPVSPVPPAAPALEPTKYDILGEAYRKAADALSDRCHLPFALLMAIGEVESSSLRGRKLDAAHNVVPPVLGPQLSGGGFAAIGDSDGGRLDSDSVWDRAVGPMQFIPGTWRLWGADGNGDGVADPQNVDDAALAAGRYLCAGGRDLSRQQHLEAAILSYNHSRRYLATVLDLYDSVMSGLVAGP
ncbi:MAG TPA: lytic transglycosylase domain-containing protein [Intrasporangium sp.]|uniref:lytic transglycosylase domain-containing protein n=1 Tax=Intrasporangium sp. TaxID=1925024 RepID=UPI002B48D554|nr:lytic transglycosylase domain-containing protein [Intrasporangium sp.]HKX66086.1 lytic transglycosylase domain-containing protein [Intrasporangium sp.]